jgi:hypothetical protein
MEPMAQKIKHLVALLYLAKSQFYYKLRKFLRVGPTNCRGVPDGVWNLDSEESLHFSSSLFKSKLTGY